MCARLPYRLYRHPVAGATNALVGLLGALPARGGVAQHQGALVRVILRVPTGELCLVGHAVGSQQTQGFEGPALVTLRDLVLVGGSSPGSTSLAGTSSTSCTGPEHRCGESLGGRDSNEAV